MGFFQRIKDFFKGKQSGRTTSTPQPASSSPTSLEARRKHYESLFSNVVIAPHRLSIVKKQYEKIKSFRAQYEEVAEKTGIPWFFVGFIHSLESNCDFKGCLHNGDPWWKKTVHVPAGRGPFRSWAESAIDALVLKNFHTKKEWGIAEMLHRAEMYNGPGYIKRGDRSPYLWGFTNHEIKGKYVRDHVFDPDKLNDQVGFAALLKYHYQQSEVQPEAPKEQSPSPSVPPELFEPMTYEINNGRNVPKALMEYIDAKILQDFENVEIFKKRNPHGLFVLALRAMVGIHEEGGNNRGKLVSMIQDTVGGPDPLAWCLSLQQTATGYAERRTGYASKLPVSEGVADTFDRCPDHMILKDPKVATIAGWKRSNSWEGHCGGVDSVFPNANRFGGIEGNTNPDEGFNRDGDEVCWKDRKRGGYVAGVHKYVELGFIDPWPEHRK